MSNGDTITDYLAAASGVPSTAPSVPSGQFSLDQNTATGLLYYWNLLTSAWSAVGGGAGFAPSFISKTANYTLTGSDTGILGDATSGNITLTLPTAVGASAIYFLMKKDSSANTVTVATTSAQTINGASTVVFTTQHDGIIVLSDGGNWRTVAKMPVSAGATGLYTAYLCYQDQKTTNTAGGTFTSGAWRTRTLTTEVADAGNHGALASNQITLDAGTYNCLIRAPALGTGRHQLRLYNTTDSAVVLVGSNAYCDTSTNDGTDSVIQGVFTIGASKALEVQHQAQVTAATIGFGINIGASFTVTNEIYCTAEFWKN